MKKKKSRILVKNKYVWYSKKIIMSKKGFIEINHERVKIALVSIKNILIYSDSNMYLAIDSLIEINNITGSNNFWEKLMWSHTDIIEDKLYQILDEFSESKITPRKLFYSILLNEIHLFYDGHAKICKILFANDDEIN